MSHRLNAQSERLPLLKLTRNKHVIIEALSAEREHIAHMTQYTWRKGKQTHRTTIEGLHEALAAYKAGHPDAVIKGWLPAVRLNCRCMLEGRDCPQPDDHMTNV